MNPEKLIQALRETDIYIEKIFLNGGCFQFYVFLKVIFPEAQPFFNDEKKDHIVSKIDGKYYDITGGVSGNYIPLTKDEIEMCSNWSFWKLNWLYKECPNCEELIRA